MYPYEGGVKDGHGVHDLLLGRIGVHQYAWESDLEALQPFDDLDLYGGNTNPHEISL